MTNPAVAPRAASAVAASAFSLSASRNGQALGCFYFEDVQGATLAANLLTKGRGADPGWPAL
jgi:hypothetical protein